MKAIRVHACGGPEAMALEDLPLPSPGRGQVLVAVKAAGVNLFDTQLRSGLYKRDLPLTLGLEGAGIVEAVGADVDDIAVGDRVAFIFAAGSYATHTLAPAERVVPLPDKIGFEEAAAVLFQGLTAHYLATSTFALGPGSSCLVHSAAGGCGILLCQIAKIHGAEVIGAVSTPAKAAIAREAGADHVVIYAEEDFAAAVKRITTGRGVDVVYDAVGLDTYIRSMDCASPARAARALWRSERPCTADRSARIAVPKVPVPHPRGPRPLHRGPARIARAHRRIVRLGRRGPAQAKGLSRLPARRSCRRAPRHRIARHDRQAPGDPVTSSSAAPPLLPLVENPDDPLVREQFDKLAAGSGILNLHRMMAHAPALMKASGDMALAFRRDTKLPRAIAELAILRAAQVLDAPYVWARHVPLARDCGVTAQQMNALASWPDSTAFTPAQKAALGFAETAVQQLALDESAAAELRRHLTAREIVELAMVVGFYVSTAIFVKALAVPAEKA